MIQNIESIAGALYDEYCKQVGGKAFNGDPLPSWTEFRADPSKQKQSNAWVETARKSAVLFGRQPRSFSTIAGPPYTLNQSKLLPGFWFVDGQMNYEAHTIALFPEFKLPESTVREHASIFIEAMESAFFSVTKTD